VVERVAPFHCTCDAATNPLPVTVRVSALDPTPAEAGRIDAITGRGFGVTENEIPAEVPPPGVGLTIVMVSEPVAVRSEAGIAAVNCVALTNVVARFDPLHCTCDPATNPLPFNVSVKALELIAAEGGWMALNTGTGLAVMVKETPPAVPPPGSGFATVTVADPAAATSAAAIAAVNWVALT